MFAVRHQSERSTQCQTTAAAASSLASPVCLLMFDNDDDDDNNTSKLACHKPKLQKQVTKYKFLSAF